MAFNYKSTPIALAALAVSFGLSAQTIVLPKNGTVTSGAATIGTTGKNMTIKQTTQNAVIDWGSFNIGAGSTVQFNQLNSQSVALNRVTGLAAPSQIDGTIRANGNVILVNKAGVIFGAGSVVDVAGIIVSTKDLSNANLNAGAAAKKFTFTENTSTAKLEMLGTVTAANNGFIRVLGQGTVNISGTQKIVSGGDIEYSSGKGLGAGVNVHNANLNAGSTKLTISSGTQATGLAPAANQIGVSIADSKINVGSATLTGVQNNSQGNGVEITNSSLSVSGALTVVGKAQVSLANADNYGSGILIDNSTIKAGQATLTGDTTTSPNSFDAGVLITDSKIGTQTMLSIAGSNAGSGAGVAMAVTQAGVGKTNVIQNSGGAMTISGTNVCKSTAACGTDAYNQGVYIGAGTTINGNGTSNKITGQASNHIGVLIGTYDSDAVNINLNGTAHISGNGVSLHNATVVANGALAITGVGTVGTLVSGSVITANTLKIVGTSNNKDNLDEYPDGVSVLRSVITTAKGLEIIGTSNASGNGLDIYKSTIVNKTGQMLLKGTSACKTMSCYDGFSGQVEGVSIFSSTVNGLGSSNYIYGESYFANGISAFAPAYSDGTGYYNNFSFAGNTLISGKSPATDGHGGFGVYMTGGGNTIKNTGNMRIFGDIPVTFNSYNASVILNGVKFETAAGSKIDITGSKTGNQYGYKDVEFYGNTMTGGGQINVEGNRIYTGPVVKTPVAISLTGVVISGKTP